MPLTIVQNDITSMQVDAIVNAANTRLQRGGGVCGAIFARAGEAELQAACDAIGHCDAGSAVITPGFKLPARYIIHTPGPVWMGGSHGEARTLARCYRSSLRLAQDSGCTSIAFPLISSGIFGYPKAGALRVAVDTTSAYLLANDDIDVYLVMFDRAAFSISRKLARSVQSYIDGHYAEAEPGPELGYAPPDSPLAIDACFSISAEDAKEEFAAPAITMPPVGVTAAKSRHRRLGELISNIGETFSQMLLRLIDEKGRNDVDVYKRANIDRKLFSKIRSDKDYRPRKNTAIALALSLELSMDETRDLLGAAGYALTNSSKSDVIISYFIEHGEYDVFAINEALFAFGQPTLGT